MRDNCACRAYTDRPLCGLRKTPVAPPRYPGRRAKTSPPPTGRACRRTGFEVCADAVASPAAADPVAYEQDGELSAAIELREHQGAAVRPLDRRLDPAASADAQGDAIASWQKAATVVGVHARA